MTGSFVFGTHGLVSVTKVLSNNNNNITRIKVLLLLLFANNNKFIDTIMACQGCQKYNKYLNIDIIHTHCQLYLDLQEIS